MWCQKYLLKNSTVCLMLSSGMKEQSGNGALRVRTLWLWNNLEVFYTPSDSSCCHFSKVSMCSGSTCREREQMGKKWRANQKCISTYLTCYLFLDVPTEKEIGETLETQVFLAVVKLGAPWWIIFPFSSQDCGLNCRSKKSSTLLNLA